VCWVSVNDDFFLDMMMVMMIMIMIIFKVRGYQFLLQQRFSGIGLPFFSLIFLYLFPLLENVCTVFQRYGFSLSVSCGNAISFNNLFMVFNCWNIFLSSEVVLTGSGTHSASY